MKRMIVILIAAVSLLALAGMASGQQTLYVRSTRAKIRSAPSFKARVLGQASRGSKLVSQGRQGSWYQVSFYGKQGYVAAILLSPYPPLAHQGFITAHGYELGHGVRRRASTYTSAAAARGLAADDRRRLSGEEKADYDGLERVEKFTLTEAEIMKFMEGGRP